MLEERQQASYDRMLRLLKATGLYRLDGGTAVEVEMRLYASYLGLLEEQLERMTDDCFLESLTRDGFDQYRKLYSLPESLSYSAVRELVKKRIAVGNRDFTIEGVQRCMAAGGFTVELSEDFANNLVTVTVKKDEGCFQTRTEKERFLRGCLPCPVKAAFLWQT